MQKEPNTIDDIVEALEGIEHILTIAVYILGFIAGVVICLLIK